MCTINDFKLAARERNKISGLMSNASRNGESREERLTRALNGAHSLLLQDVTVDYNDPVIRRCLIHEFWMVLMLVKVTHEWTGGSKTNFSTS